MLLTHHDVVMDVAHLMSTTMIGVVSVWMLKQVVILVNGLVLFLPTQVLLLRHHYENQFVTKKSLPDHVHEVHMNDQLLTFLGPDADDTMGVILDDLVVAVVGDVVVVMKTPATVAVVQPWRMRGVEDANYERQRHRYCIDDNLHGMKMTASLDGSHHHTEHENPRTLEGEVRDDGDIDGHTRRDTLGPVLHDDDDHMQDIQGHYSDQPGDDTHSRNFPHQANH